MLASGACILTVKVEEHTVQYSIVSELQLLACIKYTAVLLLLLLRFDAYDTVRIVSTNYSNLHSTAAVGTHIDYTAVTKHSI
jgi:hypothetical protein